MPQTKFSCEICQTPVVDTRLVVPNSLCNECEKYQFEKTNPLAVIEKWSEMPDEQRQLTFEVDHA